jgi:hypothetical protein
VAECRDCRAPLVWATHVETGSRMPLNTARVDPEVPGAFVLLRDGQRLHCAPWEKAVEWAAKRFKVTPQRAAMVLMTDSSAHTSHFADCPGAERFRRRR